MRTLKALFGRKEESRSYSVSGSISFVFRHITDDPNTDELAEAIRQVDAEFPWQDVMPRLDPTPFVSIKWLSSPTIRHHCITSNTCPDIHVWFDIHPGREDMARSQIYAYEKYVEKLAEELMKRLEVTGLEEVVSHIDMSASRSFRQG